MLSSNIEDLFKIPKKKNNPNYEITNKKNLEYY